MRPRSIIVPGFAAAVVAVVALILAGPSATSRGAGKSAVVHGTTGAIVIENYAFSPKSLTVRAGTTVSVTNRDMTQHTVSADDGAFDTGTIQPGATGHLTLRKPGTYSYHCAFHAFMTGTIKVVG